MEKIDFRSDTVTWPTEKMRAAMAHARLGDDVYQEDPTVNELEETAAAMLGMQAGLFVASGTMGNLTAILAHAGRGDEAIIGHDTHSYVHEAGGMATLGGVVPHPLPTDHVGRMDLNAVESAVREDDPHYPRSRLILVENSYGEKNGAAIPLDYFDDICRIARRHNLRVHLDGARFFNAVIALGVKPAALTQHVDSVSFCLSKGLCAPVGSVVCGSADFIGRARRARKALGGGMRQAGVLAAAGLIGLREMVDRLAEDHIRARRLATGLSAIPGIVIDPAVVQTNIVFFELAPEVPLSESDVVQQLREANIWLGASGPRRFRAVTHYWIDDEAVDLFLQNIESILRQG